MKRAANGRWFDRAFIALVLAASLFLSLWQVAKHDTARPGAVGIVFAPWISGASAMQRVAEAGGRIVRFGAVPFIVIAEADNAAFAARIGALGALLMLDPVALAACLPMSEKSDGARR